VDGRQKMLAEQRNRLCFTGAYARQRLRLLCNFGYLDFDLIRLDWIALIGSRSSSSSTWLADFCSDKMREMVIYLFAMSAELDMVWLQCYVIIR